jgi:thiamine pyrophosphate-dependent acetolactate synthase large subunit-like protein
MTVDASRLAMAQLRREGVDVLFSLNGGHIAAIWDACLDAGVRIVDVRHEEAAVHMAHAYARLSGRTGTACVTAGPGVTNTVTALATAHAAASPVLLVGGKVPVKQFDLGALQDVDQIAILRPVTKAAWTVLEGARAAEYLNAAVRLAHAPPHGPVYVEFPTDILREPVALPSAEDGTLAPARLTGRPGPDADLVARAGALIDQAERPVIVAGSGVGWAGAHAELQTLAERIQAPVLTTSLARGILPRAHPLNLAAARSYLLGGADLVLVAGSRFNYVLGYGRPPRLPAAAKVIQIDMAPGELNRNRVADVAIQADAAAGLAALTRAVRTRRAPRSWLAQAHARHERARQALALEAASDRRPIHPLRLCRDVVEAAPPGTVFVLDGGDVLSFGRLAVEPDGPGHFLDPGPYGCLGVGLPFANAAKVARPAAPVICISGDGAVGMTLMEFDTAVRHRLSIVLVVSNNAAWGIELNSQRGDFGEDRVVGTLLRDCRFDLIARALGGHGERVTEPDDIGGAVRRALDAGGPAIVDVVTDARAASPDLRRGLARVPDRHPLAFYGESP